MLARFIADGHLLRHLRRMHELFQQRQQLTIDALARASGGALQLAPSAHGMHLVHEAAPGRRDVALSARALEVGVSLAPLSRYAIESPRRGWVFGYAGYEAAELRAAARKVRPLFAAAGRYPCARRAPRLTEGADRTPMASDEARRTLTRPCGRWRATMANRTDAWAPAWRTCRALLVVVFLAGLASCGGSDDDDDLPNASIAGARFSNPTAVTNAYAPFATMREMVLQGTDEGEPFRSVQTRLDMTKPFRINGARVQALVIEDRAFIDGELVEVALDYFVQSDEGDVYYLGEDVDNYEAGKVVNHDGAWLLGRDTQAAGLFMPKTPRVGDRFKVEDVPASGSRGRIEEAAEVLAVDETATVPFGTFNNVVRLRLVLEDGSEETKLFAPGVGIIREVDPVALKELTRRTAR